MKHNFKILLIYFCVITLFSCKNVVKEADNSSDAIYQVDPELIVSMESSLNLFENADEKIIFFHLGSEPASRIKINLEVSASDGRDVSKKITVSPLEFVLDITNWADGIGVYLTGVDNDIIDGDIVFQIKAKTSTEIQDDPYNNYKYKKAIEFTVKDNDKAGINIKNDFLELAESGTAAFVSISLKSKPKSNVKIFLSTDKQKEITFKPSLVISPSNWNSPQKITITGKDDFIKDGDQKFAISFDKSESADKDYNYAANLSAKTESEISDAGGSSTFFSEEKVYGVNKDDEVKADIILTPVTGVMTEGGGKSQFSISLKTEPVSNVSVALSFSSDEAQSAQSLIIFTPQNWNSSQEITFTGKDDLIVDGDQSFFVNFLITSKDLLYDGMNLDPLKLTNIDNDSVGIIIENTDSDISESGELGSFSLKLKSKPISNVAISFYLNLKNEATFDSLNPLTDHSQVIFTSENYDTKQSVILYGLRDYVVDGTREVNVVFNPIASQDSTYAGLSLENLIFSNTDIDAPTLVTTTIDEHTSENGAYAAVNLSLSSKPSADVRIDILNINDEVIFNKDFFIFSPDNWNEKTSLIISGKDDNIRDGDQNFSVDFTVSSTDLNYDGLIVTSLSGVNDDNDTENLEIKEIDTTTSDSGDSGSLQIRLKTKPLSAVNVTLNSDDTTHGDVTVPVTKILTFDESNWNIFQPVSVDGVDDFTKTANQNYNIEFSFSSSDTYYNTLSVSPIAFTNVDTNVASVSLGSISGTTSESGDTAYFDVVLTSIPTSTLTSDVTLNFSSSNILEGTIDFSTLIFDSTNWNISQRITVTGIDDSVKDGNIDYTIVLDSSVSDDGNYNGLESKNLSINVTNGDDDTKGVVVSSLSSYLLNELTGTTSATFSVRLQSEPTSFVFINFASSDESTALLSKNELRFTPSNWNVDQVVTLSTVHDFIDADDVYVSILFDPVSSSDLNYNALSLIDFSSISIHNEDNASVIVNTDSLSSINESGQSTYFTVSLATKPSTSVTFNVDSTGLTRFYVTNSTLVFDDTNWNMPQSVYVTVIDNVLTDGDGSYNLITTLTTLDTKYSIVNPSDVSITVIDND